MAVPAGLVQPATVTVTEYVPAAAEVAPAMEGSSSEEVNPPGPFQEYVAPPTVLEVRFNVLPEQIGELLPAVGAAGVGLTTTAVEAGELAQPLLAITVYVPAASPVTFAMNGFCNVDVKEFGPVQLYVAPAMDDADKKSISPVHTGVLEPAVGLTGAVFTDTATVPAALVQPATVTVIE